MGLDNISGDDEMFVVSYKSSSPAGISNLEFVNSSFGFRIEVSVPIGIGIKIQISDLFSLISPTTLSGVLVCIEKNLSRDTRS